jgi:hypothetical protein
MTTRLIIYVLLLHGVDCKHEDGYVYAKDACGWVDVTGWTMDRLKGWLGY